MRSNRPVAGLLLLLAALRPGAASAATPYGTDIVNVATCSRASGADVPSNSVVTRVAPPVCIRSPVLEVAPAGTIAPGTHLTYTLTVAGGGQDSLAGVIVTMVLDPGLGDPIRYTDTTAFAAGGRRVSVVGTFDSVQRMMTWTFPSIPAGQEIRLEVTVPARSDLPADTLITEIAVARSDACPTTVSSNSVGSPVVPPILVVTAGADRTTVAPGDAVVYTVNVLHKGTAPDLTQVDVTQALPPGLRYVEGSARVDGAPIPDPAGALAGSGRARGSGARAPPSPGSGGGSLLFPLGPMAANSARILRFAAVVGPHAERGEALARSRAEAITAGGFPLSASASSVVVSVVSGPFRQEAFLSGRVFIDDDGDSAPGEGEPGVPGALVVMEDGRGAVTDITGRWHVEGVRPGLHVVRIDPSTLPPPLAPRSGGADWAGGTLTRFLEARAATLAIADFPVGPPGAARCAITAGSVRIDLSAGSLLDASGACAAGAETHLQEAANLIADRGEASADLAVTCRGTTFDPSPASRDLVGRLKHLLKSELAGPMRPEGSGTSGGAGAAGSVSNGSAATAPPSSGPSAGRGPESGEESLPTRGVALGASAPSDPTGASSANDGQESVSGSSRPSEMQAGAPSDSAVAADGSASGVAATNDRASAGASPESSSIDGASPPAQGERLEQVVRTAAPIARILAPDDGSRAARASIAVEVVYPADATPELRVNGRLVPEEQIGTRVVLPSRGVRAARYIGVPLEPGRNRIDFRAEPAGSSLFPRTENVVTVVLPGPPVELRISAPEGGWRADGVTARALRVEAVDGAGVRTTEELVATLLIEGARPLTEDLDPKTAGYQVRLLDGAAIVRMAPLVFPGRVHVLAKSETTETEADIDVDPARGPWQVTGLVEGHVAGEAGVEGDGGLPPGPIDPISDDGGRIALFGHGGIGRASQLTFSVDTAKERDHDRLFQDLEPDLFYPVSGDTSTPTAQAESQSKLFARIDSPEGFAQYGDFATGFVGTELMRYDRRMTGVSAGKRWDGINLQGFAASTEQRVVRDVFAPDGTSGPYLLSQSPIVASSETVIVEVRDRFRTDEVLSRQVRQRNIDYSLDTVAGTILFRGPVAPFDPDLNPVRVVVVYEARTGGSEQITAGGRLAVTVANGLVAGATAVREDREGADLGMVGVDLTWKPAPGTTFEAEAARTDQEGDSQSAVRFGLVSRPSPKLGFEVAYRDLPEGFSNPTYLGSPELGSRRLGGSVLWTPTDLWRVKSEAFTQNDAKTDLERTVAGVEAERRFGDASVVGRVQSARSDSPTTGDESTIVAGAGLHGPLAPRLTGEVAYQEAFGSKNVPGYPSKATAGLSYEVRPGTRAFLLQEIELGGDLSRDRTVLGIESRISANTKAEARYALEEGATGASLRSTTGVETILPVGAHSHASFSAARLDTTTGDDRSDFTSLAGGYEYRAGASLLSGRYELLLGRHETRQTATGSGAFRLRDPWTLFVRERLFVSDPDDAGSASRLEGLLGAAYRPLAGRWQFLARLDHSIATSAPTTPGGIEPGGVLAEPAASATTAAPVPGAPGVGVGPGRETGRDAFALSFAAGMRITPRQRMAATWIGRRVEADASVGLPSTFTSLLSLHYTAEVHPRWTVGGSVRYFDQDLSDDQSFGEGIEVGFLVLKNLRVMGGYNLAGVPGDDMASSEKTERGPFLSLQFKFDEHSLAHLSDLRLDRPE